MIYIRWWTVHVCQRQNGYDNQTTDQLAAWKKPEHYDGSEARLFMPMEQIRPAGYFPKVLTES